jgi:hypothetical protein
MAHHNKRVMMRYVRFLLALPVENRQPEPVEVVAFERLFYNLFVPQISKVNCHPHLFKMTSLSVNHYKPLTDLYPSLDHRKEIIDEVQVIRPIYTESIRYKMDKNCVFTRDQVMDLYLEKPIA